MKKNKLIGLITGFAILLSLTFSFSLFAQTPEPPCDFTDPCFEATGGYGWQRDSVSYYPCGESFGCKVTIYYLWDGTECEIEPGVWKDHYAFYLEAISYSGFCVPYCFATHTELYDAACDYYYSEVIAPLEVLSTDFIEFQVKPCWKFSLTDFGFHLEPCYATACCNYYYEDGQWHEVPSAVFCDDFVEPGVCFAFCGIWSNIFLPAGSMKTSLPNSQFKVAVAPNPASNIINVGFEFMPGDHWTLEIINQSGIKLFSQRCEQESGVISIDISGYSPGVYFINIISEAKILKTEKLVIY